MASHRVQRRILAASAAGLISLVVTVGTLAQTNSLVGEWQGVTTANGASITIDLVMGPDQHYSQQVRSGSLMTQESGNYVITGQNVVTFQVVEWEPKTQPVYHPTGTVGGYYAQEPTAKPPGGSFRFQFTSPTALQLQDVNFGGVIAMNRIR